MRIFLVFALVVSGCTAPSAQKTDARFWATHKPRRILVMRFEGKKELLEESTNCFISFLADNSKVEVIRGEIEPGESPPKTLSILGFSEGPPKDPPTTLWGKTKAEIRLMTTLPFDLSPSRGQKLPLLERARAEAHRRFADLVILGKVTSMHNTVGFDGDSTITIYATASGETVAGFYRHVSQPLEFSERPVVLKAVSRTAIDTLAVLK